MSSGPVDSPPPPASYARFEEPPRPGWGRTLLQFFAIPLLIVCVAVGLYLGITLMVGTGPESASDFVQLLRSDTINRRWQAAYELANRLRGADVPAEFRDPALVDALCDTLARAREEHEDPPRLAVLALSLLRRLGDAAAVPAVRDALADPHPWVRSHAVVALGALGDRESIPELVRLAAHDDPGTRQAAIAALADLDQVEGMPYHLSGQTRRLAREALSDLHEDVRFTAALVLADAGEREGVVRVLLEMLDRSRLESFPFDDTLSGLSRYQLHSNVILRAIVASTRLKCGDDTRVLAALRKLTDDGAEGDSQVRDAAREALRTLEDVN